MPRLGIGPMTISQICDFLQSSPSTIRRLADKQQGIKAWQPGGRNCQVRYYITDPDLIAAATAAEMISEAARS